MLLWGAIGVGALLLLAKSVQNSGEFGRLQPWILLLNLIGVIALSVLLARKLLAAGARLPRPRARLAPHRAHRGASSARSSIAPLLIVYLFSLEFLNRGIDSWFRVEVKQGLSDALVLSRAALDLRMREYSERTETLARAARRRAPLETCARKLDDERDASAARSRSRCSASTSASSPRASRIALETLPSRPPPDLVRQVRAAAHVREPRAARRRSLSDPHRRAASRDTNAARDDRYVVAIYRGAAAARRSSSEAVQHAYSQYGEPRGAARAAEDTASA